LTKEKTLLFLCCIAVAELASAQIAKQPPSIQIIVARMTQARSASSSRIRAYTVTRDYRLFGKEGNTVKSRVIADVTFIPPGQKNFVIRQSSGAGMGEKIVRRMLTSEVALADDDSTDISPANYQFSFLGESSWNGRRCYLLGLMPRRKDTHLIVGKAWIDAQTYLLHRAEGEPPQKPSWWVRNVHFALSYGNISGMWIPTGIEATAQVRLLGECRLVSHNVGINTDQVAANARR
jgi:hypothetical protein